MPDITPYEFYKEPQTEFEEPEMPEPLGPIQRHAEGKRPVRLIQASQIELKPIEWLIENYIERHAIVFLYGETEAFKTFITLSMACAVAGGYSWGPDCNVVQGPVLYVCGEGKNGIRRRLEAWSLQTQQPIPDNLLMSETSIDFGDTIQLTGLVTEIKDMEQPPVLLNVDTFARNFGGTENDNDDIGKFYQLVEKQIVKPFGCTVIVNHHPGKDSSKGARGGSSIKQNADAMYSVKREDAGKQWLTVMKAEKMKDAEHPKDVMFEAHRHELGIVDANGNPVTSLGLEYMDDLGRKLIEAGQIQDKAKETEEKRKALLKAIHDDPEAMQIDYAARVEVHASTISRDMKWFRKKRYISGKVGRLTITPSGKQFANLF